MSRIALCGEFEYQTGAWFDSDRAVKYDESIEWDGRNHVSRVTGGQWEHEALYQTASGRWILNHWSNWQGSHETYMEITPAQAAAWLIRDGDALPDCLRQFADALEV